MRKSSFQARRKYLQRAIFAFVVLGNASALFAQTSITSNAPPQLSPDLRAQIEAKLTAQKVQNGHVGISIRALGRVRDRDDFPARRYDGNTQPVLFEHNAQRRFLPASNVKSFAVASALRWLGADFRIPTRVMTRAKWDTNASASTCNGSLFLIGGGDPSLSTADLYLLARQIRARGIRQIRGGIIADGRAFGGETMGNRYPDGWTLDDAIWYYGPEISALAIDRNQLDVTITATKPGHLARVTFNPPSLEFANDARVQTVNSQQSTQIFYERGDARNAIGPRLYIRGNIAAGQTRSEGVAVPDSDLRAAHIFKRALIENGVQVLGGVRRAAFGEWAGNREVARHLSPPLQVLAARCLKPSDNLFAEMLLRATSLYANADFFNAARRGSFARGRALMLRWLQQSGVETGDLQFTDGSGLSRYNLVTPRATTQMLVAIENLPPREGRAFFDALPMGGVDGTLKKRFALAPTALNVRAKTGTFSIASTLSGTVTTRDNQRLAVSVLTNFGQGATMRKLQDEIFSLLANADWGQIQNVREP